MKEARKYMLTITIREPTVTRINECFPALKSYLNASCENWKKIYSSPDGATIIFLLKTHLTASRVVGDLLGDSEQPPPGPCMLRTGDSTIIVQIGDDASGTGFSQAGLWLQTN